MLTNHGLECCHRFCCELVRGGFEEGGGVLSGYVCVCVVLLPRMGRVQEYKSTRVHFVLF